MRVQVTEHVDHAVVSPSGELDTANVERLVEAITAVVDGGCHLVILDLAGVTFIDSTAGMALLREHERTQAQGSDLRLAAAPARVSRLLGLLGADPALHVHRTVAEAVTG